MSCLLKINGVTKLFPGVRALDNVSFEVEQGTVHALVGENGAGKSTLINVLAGNLKPDEGNIEYKGKVVSFNNAADALNCGISVVYQELKLVPTLTVAENVFLGRLHHSKVAGVRLVNWKQVYEQTQQLLEKINVDIDMHDTVDQLSVAKRQIVEICKALSANAELVIMDEPSASLTDKELDVLFEIIHTMKEKGVTLIYISHRLEEVFKIADAVTVLRDGKNIATSKIADIDKDGLIKLMVGRDLGAGYPERQATIGDVMLSVKNLCRKGLLEDISFDVHAGEILGIAGLVGSGRTETVRAILGVDPRDSGQVFIKGKEVFINSITTAIEHKMAFVPEDRKQQGLILDMSIKHNVSLVGIKEVLTNKFISAKKERQLARDMVQQLRIVTPSEEQTVKNLSGGNQQKVVLAKWLVADSDILIFDEPTNGIDVGAKYEIYTLLNNLAAQGKAIIMISSEMPEILGMSDRIIVMHDGRITGELSSKDATQERIMSFAIR